MKRNVFEEIKKRINLLEYVSKVIHVKPHGNKHIALCPFHSEKTPSFQIEQDLFYCFGCHSGGDLFEFYEKFHKVSKREALENLAQISKIELYENKRVQRNDLVTLKEFFIESLKMNQSVLHKEWLHRRGLNDAMIEKFELGVSLPAWKIRNFIKEQNLSLVQYGFNDYFWKMFENRIVFPIYDFSYNLVSFGGRVFENDQSSEKMDENAKEQANNRAKYINGAASESFNKSSVLYGSHFLRKNRPIYITEGYFDVILLYQNDCNGVAPMGTSFTQYHLQQAWDCSDELIVAMDGDEAGLKSALKIAHLALEYLAIGKKISFIELKNGEDIASFLEKKGELDKLTKHDLYEYIFMHECNWDVKSPDARAVEYKKLLELASKIKDPVLQKEYRRNWKDLWWSKKKKKIETSNFVSLDFDTSVLLLFKYVLLYPDILDEVSEYFIKLPLKFEYGEQLMRLLDGRSLSELFVAKIANIRLQDDIECPQDAVVAWRYLAKTLTERMNDEGNNRVSRFEANFSDQEWEKFKKWIASKELE